MCFESYANRITMVRQLDCKQKEKKLSKKDYKLRIQI